MRVAVLSLCRDRLFYTQQCFAALQEHAGTDYDHWVLDQDSQDESKAWLWNWRDDDWRHRHLQLGPENVGIARGMNLLLDALDPWPDVIVKLDNDCLLTCPDSLLRCASVALHGNAVVGPQVLGLNRPPQPYGPSFDVAGEMVSPRAMIGGIFTAVPAAFFTDWRYPESLPVYGEDDATLCARARTLGMPVGYVEGLTCEHIETTNGQHARYPEYFAQTLREGKPAL